LTMSILLHGLRHAQCRVWRSESSAQQLTIMGMGDEGACWVQWASMMLISTWEILDKHPFDILGQAPSQSHRSVRARTLSTHAYVGQAPSQFHRSVRARTLSTHANGAGSAGWDKGVPTSGAGPASSVPARLGEDNLTGASGTMTSQPDRGRSGLLTPPSISGNCRPCRGASRSWVPAISAAGRPLRFRLKTPLGMLKVTRRDLRWSASCDGGLSLTIARGRVRPPNSWLCRPRQPARAGRCGRCAGQ
jgi:hypothetical protein